MQIWCLKIRQSQNLIITDAVIFNQAAPIKLLQISAQLRVFCGAKLRKLTFEVEHAIQYP
jgi:hypothetical protein